MAYTCSECDSYESKGDGWGEGWCYWWSKDVDANSSCSVITGSTSNDDES